MKSVLALLFIVLIVSPTFALQNRALGMAQKKQIEKIRAQKGTWASFMLDLAEVHIKSGGPVDQLMEAIQEVVADLEKKIDRAEEDYEKRSDRHASEVQRITSLIDSASADIAATTEYLGVLAQQKQSFIQEIAQLEQDIKTNHRVTEESIAVREHNNALYVAKIPEHEAAIAALEEALEVLSQLNHSDVASFVQVKALSKSFEQIKVHMKKGTDKAYLVALMDLAEQSKFADQDAISKVANLMRDVKQNLYDSLMLYKQTEEAEVAAHAEELQRLARELEQLTVDLANANENLLATEQRIVDNEEFLQIRIRDKAESEQNLQDEHDSFERDTAAYEDLVAQMNTELSACEAANGVLQSAEFADYIGGRMEQDVIIDQAHGAQIDVESKFSEFQD